MKRHEVADDLWELIRLVLPRRTAQVGRPPSKPRVVLKGIPSVPRAGATWRDLSERCGPWRNVCYHSAKWRRQGAYDRILRALHIRLDTDGEIDWDLGCVDGSSVQATQAAAGATDALPKSWPRSCERILMSRLGLERVL